MRKDYVKVVVNKMWENDIDVFLSGLGYIRINFIGGIFVVNKNK